MNFSTKIELKGNVITASVIECSDKLAMYACYLYYYEKNGGQKEIVEEKKYSLKKDFSFTLNKSGYYFVKLYVQTPKERKSKDSNTVLYVCEEVINEFEEKIKDDFKKINIIDEVIDYHKFPTPSNDFCLIHSKNSIDIEKLQKWNEENQFELKEIDNNSLGKNYLISSKKGIQEGIGNSTKESQFVYCGYAFTDDELIFGQNSLKSDFDISKLYDCVGAFNLINITNDSIKITNDYVGLSKYFYYINEDIKIVCNKYHMLLLIIKLLEEKMELDEQIILLNFVSNVTLLRQTMTDELLIKNTYMINAENEIIIDRDGFKLIRKQVAEVLKSDPVFEEKEYKKLINQSAKDIINNVNSVLNSNYKYKVCELSGGKDSRFNFAALQNIPNAKENIKILSTDHEPNDLDVAVGINNLFDFDYYEDGYEYKVKDIKDYIKMDRSYFMGHHYLWYINTQHQNNTDKIVINANSVEAYCTSYYSETMLKYTNCNFDSSIDEVVKEYSKLISKQSFSSYNELADIFEYEFKRVLENTAGNSALEKFNNSFLYYRGTIHASSFNKVYYEQPIVVPAQSKSLLQAKQMWFGKFETPIVIFDLLNALHPVLGNAEFNSKSNNDNLEIYKKYQYLTPINFKNLKITLDKDRTKWNNSYKKNEQNKKYINENTGEEINSAVHNKKINEEIKEIVYDNILFALKKLKSLNNERINRLIIIPTFYFIKTEHNNDTEMRLLHNKLNSLLDVLNITK